MTLTVLLVLIKVWFFWCDQFGVYTPTAALFGVLNVNYPAQPAPITLAG